ncbi:midasin-like [Ptychodera flava]|uniref:midasin-like n=1 Tax=Ptychodera flava TaxID=63121 RepID=UPI003969C4EB
MTTLIMKATEGIAGDLQESHLNKLVDAGLEIDHNNLDIEKTNRSVFKLICNLKSLRESCQSLTEIQGFCIPAELSDEAGCESATQFEDTAAGGIGDGEGVKDVSDQIENEDQVQDVKKPGDEEKEDNFDDQPDIEDEKEGIEMSDDFEGKLHDVEKTEQDEGSEGESEDDENELDKQMGDVGDENEKLDDRMWGSDDEDDGDGD